MRKLRNATLALTTATALAVGGTAVAPADTPQSDAPSTSDSITQSGHDSDLHGSLVDTWRDSDLRGSLELDEKLDATELFGWEINLDNVPTWAKALTGLTAAGAIVGALGLILPNFVR